ncbi:MAG: hypothetical protein ACRD1P_02455, partial [Thermoanaerobaculia bacterium]
AAVAYLLWEQVVAGSIPAAPTKPSLSFARDPLTHRLATRPDTASIARLVPSLHSRSRSARLLPPGRLLALRPEPGTRALGATRAAIKKSQVRQLSIG